MGEEGTADKAMSGLRAGGSFGTIAGKLSENPRPDVNQPVRRHLRALIAPSYINARRK